MKIGVFGGTFNPVHNGHLSLAQQLLHLGYLDKILFVVSARPPHKDEPDITAKERYEMVCLALSGQDRILPCDIELKREGRSYTTDTMAQIRALYPEDSVYFITGADMFTDIPYWHLPEKLFREEKFLVADRENAFATVKYQAELEKIRQTYQPEVTFAHIDTPNISSSQIRSNVQLYKNYLPESVYAYICKHNLYEERNTETVDERIMEQLSKKLGEKRLRHTLGVAKCAKELAVRFGGNPDKAYTAGLLHDIEKEDSLGNMLRFCKNLDLDDEMKGSKALLHGPAGAEYAKQVFGSDEEIYSACYYHTVGKENMALLDKIVYLADYIEENRTQPGVEAVRKIAETDLDAAVLAAMNSTIAYLSENGMKIYKKTLDARNYLLKSMKKCDTIN